MSSSMMYTPLRDDSSHRSLSTNERTFLLNCATGQTTITTISAPPTEDANTTQQQQPKQKKHPNPNVLRTDGRSPGESRPIQLTFGRSHNLSECDVRYGSQTRVTSVVTCHLIPPSHPHERPNEGQITFSVDLSPMACMGFDYITPASTHTSGGNAAIGGASMGEETQKLLANRILRILERTLLAGGAMDAESLCVQSGTWVWRLHVQVTVLDHGGNLVDASVLAAVAALRHFRVPQVSMDSPLTDDTNNGGGGGGGGDGTEGSDGRDPRPVVVHSDDREPTPLPLHHTPLASTFALYYCAAADSTAGPNPTDSTVSTLIDPTHREELVMDGTITFSFNKYGEMCSLDFPGGCELHPRQLGKCAGMGKDRCVELCGVLEKALEEADEKAGRDRLERLKIVKEREGFVVSNSSAGAGAGSDSSMDNRHLLPDIPRVGVPFLKQTQYDDHNNASTQNDGVNLQVQQNDLGALGLQKAAIAAAEEESYRIQALDYALGHVAAKVKEGPTHGGRQSGGGGGGRPIQGGTLMAAMLKSAVGHSNTDEEGEGMDNADKLAALNLATIVSSNRTQEADDEFAQYAAAETAKVRLSSQTQQQLVPPTPPAVRKKTAPTHMEGVLDSDEEETTTTLQSEFAAKNDSKAASQQQMDIDPIVVVDAPMEDSTDTVTTVVASNVIAMKEDTDVVDDLAMAVKKKKKPKKNSKKSRINKK